MGEKLVELKCFGGDQIEVEGFEVREPLEEARNKWNCFIGDCDGESERIGDGEQLFRDSGE